MNLWWRLLRIRMRASRGPAISLWETSRVRFRVAPTDLDTVGHMNNGRYLTILDLGRLDLMVRSGMWRQIRARGWFPVVAGQTITFWRELRVGQAFEVHTRIEAIDDRWTYLRQTFVRGSVVHAEAYVRARFLRKSGGTVDHDELESITGTFPEGMETPQWMKDWTQQTKTPVPYPSDINEDA